jgi:SH3 domain-containing protein
VTNASRRIHTVIVIVSTVVTLLAGCATVPTANQTVAVPPPARSLDLMDVAIDAAKAVGLPPATKVDKANGVVEFGTFDTGATGYTAQVRRRQDDQLDVTVKRGSAEGPGTVEDKAKEFVAALNARLSTTTPPPSSPTPRPASPQPRPVPPAPTPSTPAPPPAPSRQEPAPPPPTPTPSPAPPQRSDQPVVTLVIGVPYANLRERGDPSARIIKVLPKGTRLTVLGRANQWYMVRLDDGTQGWVAESVTSPR